MSIYPINCPKNYEPKFDWEILKRLNAMPPAAFETCEIKFDDWIRAHEIIARQENSTTRCSHFTDLALATSCAIICISPQIGIASLITVTVAKFFTYKTFKNNIVTLTSVMNSKSHSLNEDINDIQNWHNRLKSIDNLNLTDQEREAIDMVRQNIRSKLSKFQKAIN